MTTNDIGWAVKQLRAGFCVRRAAWPADVYLGTEVDAPDRMRVTRESAKTMTRSPPGYRAPGEDLLADDWELA